jgi:hypothetical protein
LPILARDSDRAMIPTVDRSQNLRYRRASKQPSGPSLNEGRYGHVITKILAAVAFTLLSGGAAGCGHATPPPQVGHVQQVPGGSLRVHDSIEALDFTVVGERVLHLAWIAAIADSGRPGVRERQLWYQREDMGADSWTTPTRLASSHDPNWGVGIAAHGDEVHIVLGGGLRHFVSTTDGAAWQETPPLVGPGQVPVTAFALAAVDSGFVLATISPEQRVGEDWSTARLGVWDRRLSGDRVEAPVLIATYSGRYRDRPTPRLLVAGDSLYLVYGLIEEDPTQQAGGPTAHLFCTRRPARRGGWSAPVEIGPLSTPGASRNGSDKPEGVGEMEVARLGGRLLVFFTSQVIYATASRPDGSWAPCTAVAPEERSATWSGCAMASPTAAVADEAGLLVWIDTRYRHTDRTLANPLGGVPWSDNPDWADNAVLALPLAEALSPAAGTLSRGIVRLTGDLAYARVVRARAGAKSIYVVWAGRAKVGKNLDSYGVPPCLFTVSFPPH